MRPFVLKRILFRTNAKCKKKKKKKNRVGEEGIKTKRENPRTAFTPKGTFERGWQALRRNIDEGSSIRVLRRGIQELGTRKSERLVKWGRIADLSQR